MKKKHVLLSALTAVLLIANSQAQTVPSYLPTNGLVGWWPFNGNAIDESINTNDGAVSGATLTTDRFGNNNKAYSFNGINNYISLPAGFATGSASKSFSVWFFLTNGTYNWVLDGGTSINGKSFGLFWNSNPTINKLTFHGDGATYDYEFADINFNQWYHTVITYDGTTVKSYLNGVYIGSKNTTLNTTATTNINVGCRNNNSAYFLGKLDDIGVWNRALTQQEITNLYNGTSVGLNEFNNSKLFSVYPNPAKYQINIKVDASLLNSAYSIYDYTGKLILSGKLTSENTSIELTNLPQGIYMLSVGDNAKQTFKLVRD